MDADNLFGGGLSDSESSEDELAKALGLSPSKELPTRTSKAEEIRPKVSFTISNSSPESNDESNAVDDLLRGLDMPDFDSVFSEPSKRKAVSPLKCNESKRHKMQSDENIVAEEFSLLDDPSGCNISFMEPPATTIVPTKNFSQETTTPEIVVPEVTVSSSSSSLTKPTDQEHSVVDFIAQPQSDILITKKNEKEKIMPVKPYNEDEDLCRLKLQVLLSNFSQAQLDRYEVYRRFETPVSPAVVLVLYRSCFSKSSVLKLIQHHTGCTPTGNTVIAVAGLAKVFAGELIEEALDIQKAANQDDKPLTPHHIRQAYYSLDRRGKLFPVKNRKNPLL